MFLVMISGRVMTLMIIMMTMVIVLNVNVKDTNIFDEKKQYASWCRLGYKLVYKLH